MHELVEGVEKFDRIVRVETIAEAEDGNLLVRQPGSKRPAPLVSGQGLEVATDSLVGDTGFDSAIFHDLGKRKHPQRVRVYRWMNEAENIASGYLEHAAASLGATRPVGHSTHIAAICRGAAIGGDAVDRRAHDRQDILPLGEARVAAQASNQGSGFMGWPFTSIAQNSRWQKQVAGE